MRIFSLIQDLYNNLNCRKQVIGKSFLGKPIYCFTIKKSEYPVLIFTYSIHAREYVTSFLALEQIKSFYKNGKVGTVHFIPMINPDGVEIALTKNPLYKANARGVDLNVNFDANWGTGKQNVFIKGEQNYVGTHPFSEPESLALRDFTLKINPDMTVSYHSKGEEIYWEFFQDKKRLKRDCVFAKVISDCTGYPMVTIKDSAGGYKDWCVQKLKIPAVTIEVGSDLLSHPLDQRHLPEILAKNQRVVFALTEKFNELLYEKSACASKNSLKKGRSANRRDNS